MKFNHIFQLSGGRPHTSFPLRNLVEKNYQIKLHQNATSFGTITESQALRECYPGATYLHGGKAYEVRAWNTISGGSPFIHVRKTSPYRITRPRITTWINASLTAEDVVDDHLLKGDAGFLTECKIQFTEMVVGYTNERTGTFHSYQDLQATDSNMKRRSRNFQTSGVILRISEEWFNRGETKKLIVDRLREIFAREHSLLMSDIGSTSTNISVMDEKGTRLSTGLIVLFDNTYGSLRFTERLFTQFSYILDRLVSAAESEACQNPDFLEAVKRLQEQVADFSPATAGHLLMQDVPDGYELLFAPGSKVIYRPPGGTLPSEVSIVRAVLFPPVNADGEPEGVLMYQVELPGTTSRRNVRADFVEASADVNAWEYVWWNRATQEYENPADEESGDEG